MRNKLGETATASNGQKMTIVAYRSSMDVDVQFEDGTTRNNVRYDNFKNGHVANPNFNNPNAQRKRGSIGETVTASNGQKMTIIAYRSSTDMDVQFEDGTIRNNVRYDNFKNGHIANPNFNNPNAQRKRGSIGETVTASNGQKMTIVAYRSSMDMDVQFEDGTIRTNVRYDNFKNGHIANPNDAFARIGEVSKANNGQLMKIIAYRKSTDIDIQFEDGAIRTNVRYENFKNGAITNPSQLLGNEFGLSSDLKDNLSSGMRKVVDYLVFCNRQFQMEKIFEQCIYRSYLPFDVFVEDIGLIEFDGQQHFRQTSNFTDENGFVEASIRDQIKNTFCEIYNIPLLRIRYDQENRIPEIIDIFIAKPADFIQKHNPFLTNEEYYAIRQSIDFN